MKFFAVIFLFSLLVFVPTVFAADDCPDDSQFGCLEAPLPGQSNVNIDAIAGSSAPFKVVIDIIIQYVVVAIIMIGVIVIVAAGYVYMTASGDAGKVGMAKSMIYAALFGILLALMSFIILNTLSPQFVEDRTNQGVEDSGGGVFVPGGGGLPGGGGGLPSSDDRPGGPLPPPPIAR